MHLILLSLLTLSMIQVDQFVADNHVEWTLAPVAAPTNAAAPADLATVKPQKQDIEKELARVLRYFSGV